MWNHNTQFHPYLLRQLPSHIDRALDVGCGLGEFASKLAKRAVVVDALDVDSTILQKASHLNAAPNVRYRQADFLKANLPEASYDVIVAIASLHHMDLEAVLEKVKSLIRPCGKLLILGLYQEKTPLDYLYATISVPVNLIYLSWYRSAAAPPAITARTCPAQLSLAQIKVVANTLLPGFSLRRHLFWRYSLIWSRPACDL